MNKKTWFRLSLYVSLIGLFGCKSDSGAGTKLEPLPGNKYRGGIFQYHENADYRTLFPLALTEVVGVHLSTQIFEGLVGFDPLTLDVVPALAHRWEVDSTGTIYTFYLRKGVRFHDDPCFEGGKGREVTAHDVKFVLDLACSPHPRNLSSWLLLDHIKGAKEYYEAVRNGQQPEGGVSGIRVLNDSTIQIELTHPFSLFPYVLAMPQLSIFPKEALAKYGDDIDNHPVGTGPFYLKEAERGKTVVLARNPHYWGKDEHGNQLPYLDGVVMKVIPEDKVALMEFKKGALSMIGRLPLEFAPQILTEDGELQPEYSQYQLQSTPALAINYYGFLTTEPPFDNKLVRRAFCMAIDREKIARYTMHNMVIPGVYGVVPPAFIDYDARSIHGCSYDPDEARYLMKKAGYPDGKGFPEVTLNINAGGGRNLIVAEAIKKMLEENLNVSIKIEVLEWRQHLDMVEKGKAKFFRLGWIADYPDPESFLTLFHSKHLQDKESYVNVTRYHNPQFDALVDSALHVQDKLQRYMLYAQADQLVTEDAPVMMIYYDKLYRLLQPNIRNFPINPMDYRILKNTFFVPEGATP